MMELIPSDNSAVWLEALSGFSSLPAGVHYDSKYVSLYADKEQAEAFVYRDRKNVFFLPYVLSPIDPAFGDGRFCMETAYGYGGPLSSTMDREFLFDGWHAFKKHCCEKNIVAGLLRFDPIVGNGEWAAPDFVDVSQSRQVVLLTLKSGKDYLMECSQSTRNKIRKALKNDIRVVEDSSSRAVLDFHCLYSEVMSELNAAEFYHFKKEYFLSVAEGLAGKFCIVWAEKDGQRVGAALVLRERGVATYHLSAVKAAFKRDGVASLLRHEVANMLSAAGDSVLNYGGGLSGVPDDSLFRFKAGFSPERGKFYIGKPVFDQEAYSDVCARWDKINPESSYKSYHLRFLYT